MFSTISGVLRSRTILCDFVLIELRRRYVGTVMGPVWSIVQPLATIVIFWFVFEIGFRVKTSTGVPFFFYFITGMLPWFLFFDTLAASVSCISDNRHLVTKVVFPVEVLPVVSFVAAAIPHLVMVFIVAGVLVWHGSFSLHTSPWLAYYLL